MSDDWPFDGRSSADDVLRGRNLSGKKVIVTGANTGIGFETARALAAVGADVVLACRNHATGAAAVARIMALHPGASARFAALDLASFAQIRVFCYQLTSDRIDAVVCNAGSISTT